MRLIRSAAAYPTPSELRREPAPTAIVAMRRPQLLMQLSRMFPDLGLGQNLLARCTLVVK
jgi:hypothetical protein